MNKLPERFRLEDDGQRLVISWRWFKLAHIIGYLLALSHFGWPLDWYGEELIEEPLALLDKPAFQIAFIVGHLGLMLVLAYGLLAEFLNTTRVEASAGELLVRRGPLPWPGNRTLTRRGLAQLYGEKIRHTSKSKTHKNKVTYTYSLMAKTRSGATMTLLKDLDDLEQVSFLERTLEERLGIENGPVGRETGSGVVFKW